MPKASEGRIVHYRFADGQVRPAMIVRVWSDDCVQLQVFPDKLNDGASDPGFGTDWFRSSCLRGPGPYQWDWPPRVE